MKLGVATLEMSITEMKQEFRQPDGSTTAVDSSRPDDAKKMEGFLNKPIVTVKVDGQGKLLDAKAASGAAAARLQAELPFRLVLPDTMPEVGKAWDRPFAMKLDPPHGTGESYDFAQKYTAKALKDGYLIVGVETALKAPPKSVAEQHTNLQRWSLMSKGGHFGPAEQPLVRPVQRLAVDVLLEQALAHHQAEVAPRASPRRVRRLIDNVANVVEAARIGFLALIEPELAGLTALPGAGGEAEDLDLHAAALQRAGENVGAGRSHRDRPPAHGTGIIDQKCDHRIAEIGVLFAFERERLLRINHNAGEAGGVKLPLLKIKFP